MNVREVTEVATIMRRVPIRTAALNVAANSATAATVSRVQVRFRMYRYVLARVGRRYFDHSAFQILPIKE
jgi:hypothetical protein